MIDIRKRKNLHFVSLIYIFAYGIVMLLESLGGEDAFIFYFFHVLYFCFIIVTYFLFCLYQSDGYFRNPLVIIRHQKSGKLLSARVKNVIWWSLFYSLLLFAVMVVLNTITMTSFDFKLIFSFINIFLGFVFISVSMIALSSFVSYRFSFIILF